MIGKIGTIMMKLSLSIMMAVIFVGLHVGSSAIAAESTHHPITDQHIMAGDHQIDAAHAEIDGLPQLDFTTYTPQLFWMFVFFILLYVFFAKKTLPEISGTIENRKNHIQSDLETAEKLTAEADSVHDAYQENLIASQNAANRTIQEMEGKMKAKAEKAMDDFRARSEDEINNAEERIMTAKQQAMTEMNQIVTEVTAEAVEKILGQSPDVSTVKSTVEMLNEIPNKAKAA